MKTKNKMDFKLSKEWWEVAKEYFTKELEKNLPQHRANERILRYKLEVYQKKNSDFICGNPTNTEESGQDEEIETWLVKQLGKRRYSQRYHKTLEEGVRKKKNQREFNNRKRWKLFQHEKKRYLRYNI
jgi:hypothetical protein